MRTMISGVAGVSIIIFIFCGAMSDQQKTSTEISDFKYVGVKNCKMCHNRPNAGRQYELWNASPHATAYATLATDKAKEVASNLGLKNDPQQEEGCLVCHITAHGVPSKNKASTFTIEEGVSCEACHGPGSAYRNMKVMKDIYENKIDGGDYGLIEQNEAVCAHCHNEKSPTYRKLDFEHAMQVIAHPVKQPKQ